MISIASTFAEKAKVSITSKRENMLFHPTRWEGKKDDAKDNSKHSNESPPNEAPEYVGWKHMEDRAKAVFEKWASADDESFCPGLERASVQTTFAPVLKTLGKHLSGMLSMNPKLRFEAAEALKTELAKEDFIPASWASEEVQKAMAASGSKSGTTTTLGTATTTQQPPGATGVAAAESKEDDPGKKQGFKEIDNTADTETTESSSTTTNDDSSSIGAGGFRGRPHRHQQQSMLRAIDKVDDILNKELDLIDPGATADSRRRRRVAANGEGLS